MKIKHESKTIGEILDLRKNNMISVNPEYQRGAVWTRDQKKKLVDSVLRGYPLPLIYLHHIKRSVAGMQREDLEIIDGQQRITALWEYREGAYTLYDPRKDASEARFPDYIKNAPCSWGRKEFEELSDHDKGTLLTTKLPVVMLTSDDSNAVRDLFIRLQAGTPLNAQERRDAWPGNITELVLRTAGKPEIPRYSGHDFFNKVMRATATNRGKHRQLCAQMAMLLFAKRDSGRFVDVNSKGIDEFYYSNIGYDLESANPVRFRQILDKLVEVFAGASSVRLRGHEAIHLMLLIDSILDGYVGGWEANLQRAFEQFILDLDKARKSYKSGTPSEYWNRYGLHTRANSDRADTIAIRQAFFLERIAPILDLKPKDDKRSYDPIEREIVYLRDKKRCQKCLQPVNWPDAEIHHLSPHAQGGATTLENAVLVHSACHPKSDDAVERLAREVEMRRQVGENSGKASVT